MKFELEQQREAEWATWNWSPLFRVLYKGPMPESMSSPFDHDEAEFNRLVAWLTDQVKSNLSV